MKLITLLAVFLSAVFPMTGLAATAFVTDSVIKGTSSPDSSAWDLMYGKTRSEITSSGKISAADNLSFLDWEFSWTIDSMYNAPGWIPNTQLELNSVSLLARDTIRDANPGIFLAIFDGSNLLGLSNEVQYNRVSDNTYSSAVFSFSSNLTINSSTSYTYRLVSTTGSGEQFTHEGTTYYKTLSNLFGTGAFQAASGYELPGTLSYGSWKYPIVRMETSSVPEPASASLGLLGFAAMLMCRRRK